MYVHFRFMDGSNPYITKTNEKLFYMLMKYNTVQETETSFCVIQRREWIGKADYTTKKAILRHIAIEWSLNCDNFNYSYYELAGWSDFFETMGKKYGLLKEFKENAII